MREVKFTELYYEDAERLALYLSQRDGQDIHMSKETSENFPTPPKYKELPDEVDMFIVGRYRIAYLMKDGQADRRYKDRNLHRVQMGDCIRKLREENNLTYEDLENLTGIKAHNIESVELGRFDASIDILANIGSALGYTLGFTKM